MTRKIYKQLEGQVMEIARVLDIKSRKKQETRESRLASINLLCEYDSNVLLNAQNLSAEELSNLLTLGYHVERLYHHYLEKVWVGGR